MGFPRAATARGLLESLVANAQWGDREAPAAALAVHVDATHDCLRLSHATGGGHLPPAAPVESGDAWRPDRGAAGVRAGDDGEEKDLIAERSEESDVERERDRADHGAVC